VYPLGSVSSILFGRLADRFGRRPVMPLGCAIAVAGVLLTLAPPLPLVVTGMALLTAGFFAVHSVASGWVPARAHARGVPSGLAASLYLCSYYLGSSLFGSLGGHAWAVSDWSGVVVLAGGLLTVTAALSLGLRATRSMLTQPAATTEDDAS
jgi:YNFM family putative membrane transporter